MHVGKDLEAHKVEEGRLSCDSDASQVVSVRSDSTGVIELNRHKTNRRKKIPYCSVSQTVVRGPQVVLGFCPCGPLRLNISQKKTEKLN
jgi:hypothetical protein